MKLVAAQLDMIKASMDAGLIRDWGIKAGGDEGYAVMEGTETQIYEDLVRYSPAISFEATPVLSVAQLSETMKKLAATMGK